MTLINLILKLIVKLRIYPPLTQRKIGQKSGKYFRLLIFFLAKLKWKFFFFGDLLSILIKNI